MNANLTPSIGRAAVAAKTRGGRPAHRHNCGRHGQLTLKQIAKIAGVTPEAIRARIGAGWKGALLCSPIGPRPNHRRGEVRVPTMVTAARIALQFRGQIPTVAAIRAAHPMTKKSAERWRLVFMKALEENA